MNENAMDFVLVLGKKQSEDLKPGGFNVFIYH